MKYGRLPRFIRDRLDQLGYKVTTWQMRQMRQLEIRRREEVIAKFVDLHPTARFHPEAVVDNHMGDRDRIKIGAFSGIRGRLLVFAHGGQINIGEYCYIGHGTEIWSMELVSIGDRVLIAHNVNINDGTAHSMSPIERHEHYKLIQSVGHPKDAKDLPGVFSAPVIIEDDVWISFGVTILRGVRIGARSIIAANSIVTKDVPPDTFYRCELRPLMTPIAEHVD